MIDMAKQWEHYYSLLQTDDAKFALFKKLKKDDDPVSRAILPLLLARWLKE